MREDVGGRIIDFLRSNDCETHWKIFFSPRNKGLLVCSCIINIKNNISYKGVLYFGHNLSVFSDVHLFYIGCPYRAWLFTSKYVESWLSREAFQSLQQRHSIYAPQKIKVKACGSCWYFLVLKNSKVMILYSFELNILHYTL